MPIGNITVIEKFASILASIVYKKSQPEYFMSIIREGTSNMHEYPIFASEVTMFQLMS